MSGEHSEDRNDSEVMVSKRLPNCFVGVHLARIRWTYCNSTKLTGAGGGSKYRVLQTILHDEGAMHWVFENHGDDDVVVVDDDDDADKKSDLQQLNSCKHVKRL